MNRLLVIQRSPANFVDLQAQRGSKWGRNVSEYEYMTSYNQNNLEKYDKTTIGEFGENGTIFGKHLIVLAKSGFIPKATVATQSAQNHWIWF